MESSLEAVPRSAACYRFPALLQDIRVLDLLELSGTTQEAGRLLRLSQPTVSRRYRSLADDFALERNPLCRQGCRYGSSETMRLLRLGSRAHRLAAGVARVGSDALLQPLLARCPWLLPAPPRFRSVVHWLELVHQGVLDGALVSGLEVPHPQDLPGEHLELVPLAAVPLTLARSPLHAWHPPDVLPEVLVPNHTVAAGLQQALLDRGLRLRTAGNPCQTPQQWRQRLERSPVTMVIADLDTDDDGADLQLLSLPRPLMAPLWLVLPPGWQESVVLSNTVDQLCVLPGLPSQRCNTVDLSSANSDSELG